MVLSATNNHPQKTRKEREYSFPIRTALIHRLKVRMMPFKDAEKHAKVFMEKFMDIVALFLMPLSYVTFKGFCSTNRCIRLGFNP